MRPVQTGEFPNKKAENQVAIKVTCGFSNHGSRNGVVEYLLLACTRTTRKGAFCNLGGPKDQAFTVRPYAVYGVWRGAGRRPGSPRRGGTGCETKVMQIAEAR